MLTVDISQASVSTRMLLGFMRAAEAQGADPSRILRESAIDEGRLNDPDDRMRAEEFYVAVRAALEHTDDDLGLNAGLCVREADLGLLRFVVTTSRTIRDAVEASARYIGLVADGLSIRLTEEADVALVGYSLNWQWLLAQRMSLVALTNVRSDPTAIAITDCIMTATHTILGAELLVDPAVADAAGVPAVGSGSGGRGRLVAPVEVRLTHPRPAHAHRYEEAFGCPVTFEAEQDASLMPLEALDLPLMRSDERMHEMFEQQAERILNDRGESGRWAGKVRKVVGEALPDANLTIEDVARHLGLSRSTLARRLADEGTGFKDVVDELRSELARHHLGRSDLSTSEIAYLLGFSDVAAFHRAFKRWTKVSPGDFRRRATAG